MTSIAVYGSTSAIAKACIRIWSTEGKKLFLMARDGEQLEKQKQEAISLGATRVETFLFDAMAPQISSEAIECDQVLVCYGTLTDQPQAQNDECYLAQELQVNFLSVTQILEAHSQAMLKRGSGKLAVITSVAGMRGRQSNYIYGAAKGGLSIYLEGLNHRFAGSPISVLDIRPGFVDTPMTQEFKKGLLWANPQDVGNNIVNALKTNQQVLYTPFFWKWIMLIICLIPRKIMQKTKL